MNKYTENVYKYVWKINGKNFQSFVITSQLPAFSRYIFLENEAVTLNEKNDR